MTADAKDGANAEWFEAWLDLHCKAMGVDASTSAGQAVIDVFLVNKPVILGHWAATGPELGECTARIAAGNETPKFPNEHLGTVGRALVKLRAERERPPLDPVPETERECWQCHGLGVVFIPHPSCIRNGRLDWNVFGYFTTALATCDRPGCAAGEREDLLEQRREPTRIRPGRIPRLLDLKRQYGLDLDNLLAEVEAARLKLLDRVPAMGVNPPARGDKPIKPWDELVDSLMRRFSTTRPPEARRPFIV
jgi:hypothetical protein